MPYRFSNHACDQLVAHEMCVTVYCACGRSVTLKRLGAIGEARFAALSTYKASGWDHPDLRTGL